MGICGEGHGVIKTESRSQRSKPENTYRARAHTWCAYSDTSHRETTKSAKIKMASTESRSRSGLKALLSYLFSTSVGTYSNRNEYEPIRTAAYRKKCTYR